MNPTAQFYPYTRRPIIDTATLTLIAGLVAAFVAGFLITYLIATSPQKPHWCKTCQQVITPVKSFNWMNFWFQTGFFYVVGFLLKPAKCPVCGSTELTDLANTNILG